MITYRVKDFTVDLYFDHDPPFVFDKTDYQIFAEYVCETSVHIIIRRLDDEYIPDGLRLLILYNDIHEIIAVPFAKKCEICIPYSCEFAEPDMNRPIIRFPLRKINVLNPIQFIDRNQFRERFGIYVPVLPTSIFAVGIYDGIMYIYHETFCHQTQNRTTIGDTNSERHIDRRSGEFVSYYNIEAILHHILHVANMMHHQNDRICFLLSSTDGFPEQVPWSSERTEPRNITDQECIGQYLPPVINTHEYPVFPIPLLVQSAHIGFPHLICIPDRHYFYHNLYHPFRSFHQGIDWEEKIPKVVYGGQIRDTYLNFMDVSMQQWGLSPREYLKQIIAPKCRDFLVCNDSWISRRDMIHYKYILDIDGAASTWDATAWKLNSGSVIIKPKSIWRQWFYDQYISGIHYMEINNDMSNLREVYEWCESHPDECHNMIQHSQELFQTVYAQENVIQYTNTVLEQCILPEKDIVKGPSVPILYINLDKRTDRREQIEQQLETYGLSYERFPAIYHPFGIVGCTQSHLAVLRIAKERKYPRVWIMEDDFEFLVSREEMISRLQILCSKNIKFDVCMFAYNALQRKDLEDTSLPFFQICEAETASSYMVEEHYYDKLIELYEQTIPLLETTRRHWDYANDQTWKILQHSDHWIATHPRLGKQRHGFSDNAQEYMCYDF
jgi:glycosyl transferase, family 25